MKIKVQKIDFKKEDIDLGNDVLFIEVNGIQIQIKDGFLWLKAEESFIIQPIASNNILIKSKDL